MKGICCAHPEGELCELCHQQKKIVKKTALQLVVYLSRVDDKVYVAVDGNYLDLNDFGINSQTFHDISCGIDNAVQEALGKK
jgi:hypothetical protein